MIRYVLAFAFDFQGQVALIKKNKPNWQRGRLNGIGGKIEMGELPHEAMTREFQEETGVVIEPLLWEHRGHMIGTIGFSVDVFKVVSHRISTVQTMEEELVALYSPAHLVMSRCIENVPALIALCQIPVSEPSGVFPKFQLTYLHN